MAESGDAKALLDAEKKKEQSLPFYQLFSFADKYDWLLMISGSLGTIIHGSSMLVFFLLFGEMVNGFGRNQSDLQKMTQEVSKCALYFVYLGLVICFSSYAEIACWMYSGERQASTLRKKYLEAVLRQDVGFFDTDARTRDVVFSVSTDTLLVQDAISKKPIPTQGSMNPPTEEASTTMEREGSSASSIWKHFTKAHIEENKYQLICKHCGQNYKFVSDQGYGTFQRHLRSKHPTLIGIDTCQQQISGYG